MVINAAESIFECGQEKEKPQHVHNDSDHTPKSMPA
jgi:hypothetical protein